MEKHHSKFDHASKSKSDCLQKNYSPFLVIHMIINWVKLIYIRMIDTLKYIFFYSSSFISQSRV